MPAKSADGEAFLSRWSRRKQDGGAEPAAGEAPADMVPAGDAVDAHPGEDEPTDEELLAKLHLPDPETMRASDDFSAFMQSRVPERLRRRALRTLWRSNPVLANLDELIDYGEDYTDAATVIENMQTVYEVGKGAAEKWKRHVAALAAAEEDEERNGEATPSEPPVAAEEARTPDIPALAAPTPDPVEARDGVVELAEALPPCPRHMRFRFD